MVPCSSGNSPTMAERRSSFAIFAASSAWSGSAPTSGAISRARAAMRATRSACDPSLLWKVTDFSPSAQVAIPARASRRSLSQKKAASDRRAASTRWLPFRMVSPWSGVSILATVTKPSIRPVFGLRAEKNFWCSFIEVCRTSGGRDRKRSSMAPIRATGHSTRPATSDSSPSSGTISQPRAKARFAASCRIAASRSWLSSMTLARRNLAA